jgi:arylsulfatase
MNVHALSSLIGSTLLLSLLHAPAIAQTAAAGPASAASAATPVAAGHIGKTYAESREYWPAKPQPPAGAPNVLWILIDDAGYGSASAFGGLMETPTLDALANDGLRFTNFHTTAISSPTRAALLTGRNSHSVHMGLFPVTSAGFPGYDGILPDDKATIAEDRKSVV